MQERFHDQIQFSQASGFLRGPFSAEFIQKGRSIVPDFACKVLYCGSGDVRKRGARAKRRASFPSRAERQDWNIFARMIRAGIRWVASMVRREDHQIPLPHRSDQFRQTCIKVFQRFRIAFHIVAMAVKHIEIHQIRKNKRTFISLQIFEGCFDPVMIVFVWSASPTLR